MVDAGVVDVVVVLVVEGTSSVVVTASHFGVLVADLGDDVRTGFVKGFLVVVVSYSVTFEASVAASTTTPAASSECLSATSSTWLSTCTKCS